MTEEMTIVDVMQEIVASMQVKDPANPDEFIALNYQPGRSAQILQIVSTQSLSAEHKDLRYPLIAMLMPIREPKGLGASSVVRIDRIIIACLTDSNKSVLERYAVDETFKTILYPCYNELLNRIALSTRVNGQDPAMFPHTKMDMPGNKPINAETNDIIDCIEILNLEIPLLQIKTC